MSPGKRGRVFVYFKARWLYTVVIVILVYLNLVWSVIYYINYILLLLLYNLYKSRRIASAVRYSEAKIELSISADQFVFKVLNENFSEESHFF